MVLNQALAGLFIFVLLTACPTSGNIINPKTPSISNNYSSCIQNCEISGGAGGGLTFCKNTCIINEATRTKNADLCAQIVQGGDDLTKTQPLMCYRYVATATSDPSICDRLTDQSERQVCRDTVG